MYTAASPFAFAPFVLQCDDCALLASQLHFLELASLCLVLCLKPHPTNREQTLQD